MEYTVSLAGYGCDRNRIMHHVRCAVAISKTGRKITVTIEKSKGVALVPVGLNITVSSELRCPLSPF